MESSLHTHERYEELCALVASGQCPSGRCLAADFGQLSAQALGEMAGARAPCGAPAGMTERFIARARTLGITIRGEVLATKPVTTRRRPLIRVASVTTVALLLAALFVRGSHIWSLQGRGAVLPTRQSGDVSASSPSANPVQAFRPSDTGLPKKLATAQAELRIVTASLKTERDALESANRDKGYLRSLLGDLENENADLRNSRSEQEPRIRQLENDLEKSNSERNADHIAALVQENELRDLRRKVAEQTAAAKQQQQLTTAGSQVRDLVVARNLHIIDVYDRDGNGKSQRPFGRIFYTEGKSLIFYAYDLADPRKLDTKISFYVWGEQLGTDQSVKNLGIFHDDDVNEGRWVLTFDDPSVLAQINSVFVTVEATKNSVKEPNGKRILFAYLGNKANHP